MAFRFVLFCFAWFLPSPFLGGVRTVLVGVRTVLLFSLFLFPLFAYSQARAKNDTVVTLKCDGRFTLGTKSFKLMYGYPYPYSTSHFLVNVNAKIGTNRPYLANTTYLKGTQKSIEVNKGLYTTVVYEFDGVKIMQRLVPVDKELEELNGKNYTQYYRVEYEIINETKAEKRVGLIALFDTQIAENDACIMQTCKYDNIRKGKGFLEKMLALFSFSSQKRERAYYNDEVPEVVLVFRNDKRQKDITGVFILDAKKATPPDEALIGRWTYYRNIRWGYPNPNDAVEDYTDSALLLRWKERGLPAFEKRTFVTYYGVLDTDTLGVKMTLPPDKSGTSFVIEPDTIYQGESAQLIWETKNPIKANIMISGLRNSQANKGTQKVNPFKTQTYTLRLVLEGKEVEIQERLLVVLPPKAKKIDNNKIAEEDKNKPKVNNKIAASEKKYDGRFTIGSEGKNLLFGYPYNYSTSHFVVQVGEGVASNYDQLGGNSVYLSGKLTTTNEKGSPKTQVIYDFEGVRITQKLTPVSITLQEVPSGSFGQYYWIEYSFENTTAQSKEIGFALMIDAMIGDDDNGLVKGNNKTIPLNTKLVGEDVPASLFIFPAKNQFEVAELILSREKATKPSEVSVGIWQHLNSEGYHAKALHKNYTNDCALHLRWHKKTLKAKETMRLGIYYGNTTNKLVALHHQQKESLKYDVFFDLNESVLTEESLKTLLQVLTRKDYAYLVLEGFTDKTGSAEGNYALSQKRVQAVRGYLTQNGIDVKRVLVKSHGQHFAGKEHADKERRVSVTAFD